MKVLLMAYECSPYRGSEWAVGWGRLLQAARAFETHVITSEENFAALERARVEGLVPLNVRFYTPEPDGKLRAYGRKPGLFAYNYRAYAHWQRLAFGLARQMHARERFALVHQVNVCTFREPGYCWQLGIPYVWGPVGGSQNVPWRFLPMLGAVEGLKEGLRGVSNWMSLRCKPRVRAAARAAVAIVGANSTNQRDYERVFGREVGLLLETGLQRVEEQDRARFEERALAQQGWGTAESEVPEGGPGAPGVLPALRILWSGEFQSRKALPVLLRALARLRAEVQFVLRVVGDGPMRPRWVREAQRLGLADRVEFMGRLPFAQAVAQMQWAHLFCFTSLRDTSGNVVLEALAAGVPVVCFDHQGAGDMVDASCGVKLDVTSPGEAVAELTGVIRNLADDGERLLGLSRGAAERARAFLWDANGDVVNAMYRDVTTRAGARMDETMKA